MSPRSLSICTLGPIGPPDPLPSLRDEIRRTLALEPRIDDPRPLRFEWRAPDGSGYDADRIVDELAPTPPGDPGEWRLFVTDADLVAPDHGSIFGEAIVGGTAALISLARLRDREPALVRLRAVKEALHELGHLAGLPHCDHAESCVMIPAATVAEIDARSSEFCPHCRERAPAVLLDPDRLHR